TDTPRSIDKRKRRRVGRGGIAMHHRRENNTTGEARQTHHAPSMREKYDGWGVGDLPRTTDERIIRRVGRGRLATHHRWEKNTTGGVSGAHHEKITLHSRPLLHATTPPREDNTKFTTSSSRNTLATRR